MAERGLKLSVRIPNFMTDPEAWRRAIHAAIVEVQDRGNVRYAPTDKLEVDVCFHLQNPKLTILDLDNRLKDVLDALQGFIGEKGKSQVLRPIIPNDNQIYRLTAEKRLAPKVNRAALSTIVIRRYDRHGGTAREPRDTRKHVRPEGAVMLPTASGSNVTTVRSNKPFHLTPDLAPSGRSVRRR